MYAVHFLFMLQTFPRPQCGFPLFKFPFPNLYPIVFPVGIAHMVLCGRKPKGSEIVDFRNFSPHYNSLSVLRRPPLGGSIFELSHSLSTFPSISARAGGGGMENEEAGGILLSSSYPQAALFCPRTDISFCESIFTTDAI